MARTRQRTALWPALTLPGTAWLVVFFVVPFYAIAAVAFGGYDVILARARPIWNPLDWRVHSFWVIVDDVERYVWGHGEVEVISAERCWLE